MGVPTSTKAPPLTLSPLHLELVAFVQVPQRYHNLDTLQHRVDWRQRRLYGEQDVFFNLVMPGKDPGGAVATLAMGVAGTVIGCGVLSYFWQGHIVSPISPVGSARRRHFGSLGKVEAEK